MLMCEHVSLEIKSVADVHVCVCVCYIWETDRQDLVPNLQAPIFMSRSAFNDLGDINAVISRYVLVSHPAGNAET